MTTQYDSIATIYSMAEVLPFRPYVELYTVLKLIGDVNGKDVLDVACGDGLYARLHKKRGAARVVGTDLSEGMIQTAQHIEEITKLGIEYLTCDAADLPVLGSFDLVTAIYLLHYAPSKEHLRRMCKNMYANLKPGGRLVTVLVNPDFDPKGPNSTKYGFTMHMPAIIRDGEHILGDVHVQPPFHLECYYWNRQTYENTLLEAGFKEVSWPRPECSPDGEARYGHAFWEDYLKNPHAVPLVCTV